MLLSVYPDRDNVAKKKKPGWLLAVALALTGRCAKSPTAPEPPSPPSPPPLTEKLVGRLFFHDFGPGNQLDIYLADLYLVPKEEGLAAARLTVRFAAGGRNRLSFSRGIERFPGAEIGGQEKEGLVAQFSTDLEEIDISKYDFVLRNLEDLTEPTSDDFAVDVSSRDWIAYVKDPDGRANDPHNTEIVFMDLADRVIHPLTPINGQYAGWNVDPHWKDDSTITWIHAQRMVEVSLDNLNRVSDVLPGWSDPQFDPVYSPDRTRLLFNTWIKGKKNSFIKYLQTGAYASCLPDEYFSRHTDDNPTWVFSNTLITGHIFMAQRGRIYTRDLETDVFHILTDSQRDFRYVTPVLIENLIYLVFVDWSDSQHKTLWISDLDGTDLRALNSTGDEPVFVMLGLPAGRNEADLERAALEYSFRFDR
jgi:hypothetical protein